MYLCGVVDVDATIYRVFYYSMLCMLIHTRHVVIQHIIIIIIFHSVMKMIGLVSDFVMPHDIILILNYC